MKIVSLVLAAGVLLPLAYFGRVPTGAVAKVQGEDGRNASSGYPDQPLVAPGILTRQQWHARAALPGLQPQDIRGIILHNTGVHKNPAISLENKMRGLQSFSQNPGMVSPGHFKPVWPDVPYHFYIDASGRIAEGRDVRFAGDTNTNYNTSGYVQVVIEGDFEVEYPNPKQLAAARELVAWLLQYWNLPIKSVSVHQDHAATDCPGRNFMSVLPTLLTQISQKLSQVRK